MLVLHLSWLAKFKTKIGKMYLTEAEMSRVLVPSMGQVPKTYPIPRQECQYWMILQNSTFFLMFSASILKVYYAGFVGWCL